MPTNEYTCALSHNTHKDFNIVHICQLTPVFETVNMSEVETFVDSKELKEDETEVENRKQKEEFKKQNVTVTRTVSKEGIKVKGLTIDM